VRWRYHLSYPTPVPVGRRARGEGNRVGWRPGPAARIGDEKRELVASIQVIQGPDKGRTFELGDREQVVGRDSESVRLSDGTVSRRHACLWRRNGRWVLEDYGSANGTYLNGVRVRRGVEIHGGDQIRCGSTLLVFASGTGAEQVDVDEDGQRVDAAIVATLPSSEDSVIIPTPEAGAEAIDNLRILYNLITEVGSIFNVDALLRRTLERIFDVVKADRGYIMLIDEQGKLTLKASRLASGRAGEAPPISRTLINEVVRNQVGVLSSNAMSDKRFAAGKSVHAYGIRSAVCAPIRGRDRILGVIHVDSNVSEHTYSTEQLRLLTAIGYQTGLAIENVRLYESAVQSERLAAVGETVAFLSHHIKNILQSLGAGVDIVQAGLQREDLDKARRGWPIVQRSLGRIHNLILNMLTFSKDREPLREPVDVNQVLEDCLELIRPRADERGVAVLSDLDDMPPLEADAAGLRQAFMNLLTNALDAVADQTGIVTVRSAHDPAAGRVRLQFVDNGTGIEPRKLDEIFTPFHSGKGQQGTGLGLAVTHKIVREHGGDIDVQSRLDEGSTFTILLPARQPTGQDPDETNHAADTHHPATLGHSG